QYQKPLLDVLPTINGFHVEEGRMNDESEPLNGFSAGDNNGYRNGMDGFMGDDEDAPYMEENPFANEPPAWLNEETASAAQPGSAKAASPATIAPARQEEAAPDNPYLHESRNLREEDGDFEIPLPASLRDDPSALAQVEATNGSTGEKPAEKAV